MAYWLKKASGIVLVIPNLYGKPMEYSPMQIVERFTVAQIEQMRCALPTRIQHAHS